MTLVKQAVSLTAGLCGAHRGNLYSFPFFCCFFVVVAFWLHVQQRPFRRLVSNVNM